MTLIACLFAARPLAVRFLACACSFLVVSCASIGEMQSSMPLRQGAIEQISPAELQSSHHAGVGAVVGGLAGLGIGSLNGSGTGRDVAEVLGELGGAMAGNEVQKKYDQPVVGQNVVVRISNGVLVSVTQPLTRALSVGQRVYIEGSGEAARVIPR
ncbi:MAG TPA: hypothetical protein VHQ87_14350 [Rhizobacter sp.]|nr:hypothetical protein [Rhizobacter sp.]